MERSHYILMVINALYLVPLIIIFAIKGNWEFLAYIGQVVALLVLLIATIHKTHFPIWLLSLLSVWSALHMAGGSVVVGDGVLYAYRIHEFIVLGPNADGFILRYDQVIHCFGFFVATFVAYWLLLPQMKHGARIGVLAFIAALAGMGFGAINEVVEFGAVLAVPDNGVGGYYNTAIDLCANAVGATLAAVVIVKMKLGLKED